MAQAEAELLLELAWEEAERSTQDASRTQDASLKSGSVSLKSYCSQRKGVAIDERWLKLTSINFERSKLIEGPIG